MTTMTSKLYRGVLVAAALCAAPAAFAGPPSVSPDMQRALVKADAGPDALRRYLFRTRMMFHALNYDQVMALHEAIRAAQTGAPKQIAGTPSR